MANSDEGFATIDTLASEQKMINCYQMQADDNNRCNAIFLGKYQEVPLPINKIIEYNNHVLNVVTYILTDEDLNNKIYKIVGVYVFRKNEKDSLCSLDLCLNDKKDCYVLMFNDHEKNTSRVVKKLEKFPGRDNVLEYIISKSFEDPLKSILLN